MGDANKFEWKTYKADDATEYSMRVRKDIAAIAELGWSAFNAANPPAPKGFQPRYVMVYHGSDGRSKKVVVADPASDVWTGADSSITMAEYNDADGEAWVVTAKIGERATVPHVIHP